MCAVFEIEIIRLSKKEDVGEEEEEEKLEK